MKRKEAIKKAKYFREKCINSTEEDRWNYWNNKFEKIMKSHKLTKDELQ